MAIETTPVRVRRPSWEQPRWAKIRVQVYERDSYTCQYCGWTPAEIPENYDGRVNVPAVWFRIWRRGEWVLTFEELVIDHIIPISRGGTNHLVNFQALCGTCNRRKWNKVPA